MNKILLTLAIIAALFSSAAMAQRAEPLMFGGKGGFMKPHGSDNDSAISVGAVMGRKIQGNLSWEAELNLTLTDGEIGNNRDWNINSLAGYAVYRSDGDIHVKGKIGVAYWDDDFDEDTSLTMGVGIGIRMGRGTLDVEYTQINDYVDYISVGYILPF